MIMALDCEGKKKVVESVESGQLTFLDFRINEFVLHP